MGKIVWREEDNLLMLKRLLAAGATASAIGNAFSQRYGFEVSRNAIIGIVHRLSAEKILVSGFLGRPARMPKPVRRIMLKRLLPAADQVTYEHSSEKLQRGKLNQLEVVSLYEPIENEALAGFNWERIEQGRATQLSGLKYEDCRWPVHGDTGRTFLFCAGPRLHNGDKCTSPYCGYHTHIARRPPPDPDAPRIHPSRRRKQGAGGVS